MAEKFCIGDTEYTFLIGSECSGANTQTFLHTDSIHRVLDNWIQHPQAEEAMRRIIWASGDLVTGCANYQIIDMLTQKIVDGDISVSTGRKKPVRRKTPIASGYRTIPADQKADTGNTHTYYDGLGYAWIVDPLTGERYRNTNNIKPGSLADGSRPLDPDPRQISAQQESSPPLKKSICELIYVPDEDLVIPLYEAEALQLKDPEQSMDAPACQFQDATDPTLISQAGSALCERVNRRVLTQPLVDGTPAPYVEITRFGKKKWSYVPRNLIDKFKQGGAKAFCLATGQKSTGVPPEGQKSTSLRTQDGQLDIATLKQRFCRIGVDIKKEWHIVAPRSESYSVRHMFGDLAELPGADNAIDRLDNWIQVLNKNLKWSISQKQLARDRALDLLEKAQIFDEDDLGQVRDTIVSIWGKEPKEKAWVQQVQQLTYAQLDRKKLAAEIRARPLPESKYNLSAQAQLMRYAYGITAGTEFILAEGKLAAKAEAKLNIALFEGKVDGKTLLPDEDGLNIDIPIIRKDYQHQYTLKDNTISAAPTFDFNKTFLTLPAMRILVQEFKQWARINAFTPFKHQTSPLHKLQLKGHADTPGTNAYNLRLSRYRAQVIYGFLTRDSSQWAPMFSISPHQGGWSTLEMQTMLSTLGFATTQDGHYGPHTQRAVKAFQAKINMDRRSIPNPETPGFIVEDGIISLDTRDGHLDPTLKELIEQYMRYPESGLVDELTPEHFNDPPYIGKGESDPKEETPGPNETNRRVEWSLYRLSNIEETINTYQARLGRLRLSLELYLAGFAGASLLAGASIHFDINPANATDDQKGRLLAKGLKTIGPGVSAEASAFAGAKAEIGCKGTLQWLNPEPVPPDIHKDKNQFVDLGSVGYSLIGQVGLNLTGKFQIGFDFESQKFLIKVEASAALGPGFGGKLAFVVGVKHTFNFITMVYTQLRKHNFSFVDFFDNDNDVNVFDLFCSWSYQMLLKGRLIEAGGLGVGAIGAKVIGSVAEMTRSWKRAWETIKHAQQLIENINSNTQILRYTTPEVKGRILYLLVRPHKFAYDIETFFDSLGTERKQAVSTVLAWIQSKRHCREVLEHMGVDIPQGDSATKKAERYAQNKDYLIEYLEGLGVTAAKWQQWHDALPDEVSDTHRRVSMRKSPADY